MVVRHAMKSSGAVTATGGSTLSTSNLSSDGRASAIEAGKSIPVTGNSSPHMLAGHASPNARTSETIEYLVKGILAVHPNTHFTGITVEDDLGVNLPADFLAVYDERFVAERKRLMVAEGLDPKTFKTLSAPEQARFAEAAEEPVITDWLTPKSELFRMYDPAIVARRLARYFLIHTVDLANKMKDGEALGQIHCTHKSVPEPFLTSGVLISKGDKRITSLRELGGSFGLLETATVITTRQGTSVETEIWFRGAHYAVDEKRLNELSPEPFDGKEGR